MDGRNRRNQLEICGVEAKTIFTTNCFMITHGILLLINFIFLMASIGILADEPGASVPFAFLFIILVFQNIVAFILLSDLSSNCLGDTINDECTCDLCKECCGSAGNCCQCTYGCCYILSCLFSVILFFIIVIGGISENEAGKPAFATIYLLQINISNAIYLVMHIALRKKLYQENRAREQQNGAIPNNLAAANNANRNRQVQNDNGMRGYQVPMNRRVIQQNVQNNLNRIYKLTSIAKDRQDEECTVCLEKLTNSETQIVSLRCKHYFHQECIDEWVKRNQTCPACRKDVVGGPDFSEEEKVQRLDEDGRSARNGRLFPRLRPQNYIGNRDSVGYPGLIRPLNASQPMNESEIVQV